MSGAAAVMSTLALDALSVVVVVPVVLPQAAVRTSRAMTPPR